MAMTILHSMGMSLQWVRVAQISQIFNSKCHSNVKKWLSPFCTQWEWHFSGLGWPTFHQFLTPKAIGICRKGHVHFAPNGKVPSVGYGGLDSTNIQLKRPYECDKLAMSILHPMGMSLQWARGAQIPPIFNSKGHRNMKKWPIPFCT